MLLLLAEIRCITPNPTLQRRPIGRSFCGWLKNMAGSISILSRLTSTKARLMFIEIIGIPASDAGPDKLVDEGVFVAAQLVDVHFDRVEKFFGKKLSAVRCRQNHRKFDFRGVAFLKNPQLPVVYLKVNMFLGHVFLLMVCKSIIKNY